MIQWDACNAPGGLTDEGEDNTHTQRGGSGKSSGKGGGSRRLSAGASNNTNTHNTSLPVPPNKKPSNPLLERGASTGSTGSYGSNNTNNTHGSHNSHGNSTGNPNGNHGNTSGNTSNNGSNGSLSAFGTFGSSGQILPPGGGQSLTPSGTDTGEVSTYTYVLGVLIRSCMIVLSYVIL